MASEEDKQELLLSCRYGELDEVRQFVDKFGSHALADVRDDHGNSILHMTCGNGHEGAWQSYHRPDERENGP